MGVFDNMLKSNETLFKSDEALDFSFQPKIMKYREEEQRQIASCIAPLYQGRDGRNMFIHGKPGIGKTLAVQKILEEIEEDPEVRENEIIPIYVNCWQKNTSFKIIVEICESLGYKFTQNKKTEELFKILEKMINKHSAVFCFDEVDKLEDMDFLYTLCEKIYRKSIIMITNPKSWISQLEDRVKSRLSPDQLEFKPYNANETQGILTERASLAFYPSVLKDEALNLIIQRAIDQQDIRAGLHLFKEAGNYAESRAQKNILPEHVKAVFQKLDELSVNDSDELQEDDQELLDLIKENSGKRIGDLFKLYQNKGGKASYKTFQRRVKRLQDGKFITVKKISGGSEGSTTIIHYLKTKKLTEF